MEPKKVYSAIVLDWTQQYRIVVTTHIVQKETSRTYHVIPDNRPWGESKSIPKKEVFNTWEEAVTNAKEKAIKKIQEAAVKGIK